MSDFQRYLKTAAKSKAVKVAERGEQGEGIRDALNAGKGNLKAGVAKLGLQKTGLKQAMAKEKLPAGKTPKGRK